MKSFFKLLISGVFFIESSFAQNSQNFESVCVNADSIAEVVAQFEETPSLTMKSMRETTRGSVENRAVLFINYKTKSWTLVERISSDRFCVIALGEDISPYVKNKD
jgi:hypothetical protein